MENEQVEKAIARKSARVYLPISLGIALLFFLAASMVGDFPPVARFGGSAWVALLTLIISMPVVIPRVKKGMREKA